GARRRARRKELRERGLRRVAHPAPKVELERREAERHGAALENAAGRRWNVAAAERAAGDDLRARGVRGRIESRHAVRALHAGRAARLLDLRDRDLEIAVTLERGADQCLEARIADEVASAERARARALER